VVGAPDGDYLIGRETELKLLAEFVSPDPPARALLFTGEPGIGKTALWEAGIGLAGQCGFRVLAARPSEAETVHSFAALFDLLETVGADILAGLPGPQRRALEVALLRSDPAGLAPDPFAVAAGLLGVLRSLAAATPLLVAIDDLQWLDPASADALAFAMRRLGARQRRFLLARRSGRPGEVEGALGASGVRRLEVRPLSIARPGQGKPARAAQLTAAEQRVAAFAAQGLSNKQIAARLSIAVHTVEVHLAHVYVKLAVRSRTQLASYLGGLPGPDAGE
jgi:DNA-binding CsgD family transcriptional regulator